jgi:hypothetical protein
LLWLDRVVAASVSEWMSCHSLTLAATPEMKKTWENWHRDDFGPASKDPGQRLEIAQKSDDRGAE